MCVCVYGLVEVKEYFVLLMWLLLVLLLLSFMLSFRIFTIAFRKKNIEICVQRTVNYKF